MVWESVFTFPVSCLTCAWDEIETGGLGAAEDGHDPPAGLSSPEDLLTGWVKTLIFMTVPLKLHQHHLKQKSY